MDFCEKFGSYATDSTRVAGAREATWKCVEERGVVGEGNLRDCDCFVGLVGRCRFRTVKGLKRYGWGV